MPDTPPGPETRAAVPAAPTAPAALTGLTQAEAAARLRTEGSNALPGAARRTPLAVVREMLSEPMFGLLLAGGALYLALGDAQEALILLGFASLSVAITVAQALRTERVLDALRNLSSPRALVIRDGQRQRIPGVEVVRGDLLVIAEGDRVAADAVLRSAQDLQADESLLTGESVPVAKTAAAGYRPPQAPGGDGLPFVYAGSMVVHGQGVAEVLATGAASRIGRIGATLGAIDSAPPPLHAQVRRLVRVVALAALAVSSLFVLAYGLTGGAWLQALLGGVALAMSLLPEEFPLVLTLFMTMGAWRIAQARVLTRRSSAIETLGAATVLCTDKTGTMTRNRMAIALLETPQGRFAPAPDGPVDGLPDDARRLLEAGVLASAENPFDPMDSAFHDLAGRCGMPPAQAAGARTLARVYGLRPDLLAVTQAWTWVGGDSFGRSEDSSRPDGDPTPISNDSSRTDRNPPPTDGDLPRPGGTYLVAAKGAPEAVAQLCGMAPEARAALARAVEAIAAEGARVLAVAIASHPAGPLPESPRGFAFEWLGLVGLADPLRPGVPEAVRQCRGAGIRVVMITGDHPATAQAIAARAGLDARATLTGAELDALDDAALAERVRAVSVFARIMPEQKLRLIQALRARGEVVAMTGDGVNDAPSLKAAHIGIAMGGRGTDVAREAASLVLLDDDFGSIVRTVRLGRRIYDNLRKAMQYLFAVHVPIAGLALLPLAFGAPMLLGPIHIAFLEMVIDPVCSVAFEAEPEEADVMDRAPRAPAAPLLSAAQIGWGLLQGLLVLALLAGLYLLAVRRGMPQPEVRALVFVSLVLTNIGLILVNRSFSASLRAALRRSNVALWAMVALAVGLLAAALGWPAASALFAFGPLHGDDLAVCLAAGVAVVLALELLKSLWRGRLHA